ncbi:unnamed protein product [Anisakis simplex]|uniref:Probable ATP-dependent RNA helicase DDX55 homolog (inferred by orthology to a C. elegans protein) n=1 Tax=Anisakis simplex TaxID=6269 RepID=A0A0M3JAL3_ANISI|nr:unnamed protein product [Anisakis simplex]
MLWRSQTHRIGRRCARSGRPGKNLLLLTTEESGYVEFISKYESLRMENIKIKTSNALKAEELRIRTIKMAVQDRDILECGTRAFVSMIESYVKHDCGIVCGLKNLNVVGLAHAYSLLRLPRMPELKDRDLSAFKRSDEIDTSQIKFQQKSREIQRLKQRKLKNEEKSLEKAQKNASEKKKEMEMENAMESKRKRKISKDDDSTNNSKEEDWEEMASDMALLKKFKRGRLSKKELSELLDD